MEHYDIFISYKRISLPTANNLYYRLTTRGYSTFFDLEEMRRDNFNIQLLNYIENAKDVFVILEEGSLDGCKRENWEEEDWFCHEIAFALEKKKNIIPILLGDFKMPNIDFFPEKLKELSLKHSPDFSFSFFDAYLDKLIEKRFITSEAHVQNRATSVFKFYSNENCQVFKEGKMVCSLEGMSDEPYYLPVSRKGDYQFEIINTKTNERRILEENIDVIEEKIVRISWDQSLRCKNPFHSIIKNKPTNRALLILGAFLCLSVIGYMIYPLVFGESAAKDELDNAPSDYDLRWTDGVYNLSVTNDHSTNPVLINARLLDPFYIKNDPVISKAISYDAYMGIDKKSGLGPFYDFFHYIDTLLNGKYSIMPYGKYVGDYYFHDSITIQDGGFLILGEDYYTNLHYPILDVSIVNNSSQTVLVNELLIEVEESHVDPNPFVIIRESGGYLYIEDAGWKSWGTATLLFSLLPASQKFNGHYKFKTTVSSKNRGGKGISMYNYFVQSGINFEKLCQSSLVKKNQDNSIPYWFGNYENTDLAALDSLRNYLFPVKLEIDEYEWENEDGELVKGKTYIDPYLVLHGKLIFDNGTTFKVGGSVRFLTSEGWGAPGLDCSRVFDVKLKTNGKNYVVKHPVSHYLKSGETDRIAIQLNADKTSYHTFKVRLHTVNQIDIVTAPVDLLIFKYNH